MREYQSDCVPTFFGRRRFAAHVSVSGDAMRKGAENLALQARHPLANLRHHLKIRVEMTAIIAPDATTGQSVKEGSERAVTPSNDSKPRRTPVPRKGKGTTVPSGKTKLGNPPLLESNPLWLNTIFMVAAA